MGSTVLLLVVALIIGFGVKTIARDWGKKFAEEDKASEERKKAQIERNKQEVKRGGVVNLERGQDGVYRPKSDDE